MARSRGSVAGLSIIKAIVWAVYALVSVAIIVLSFAFVLLLFDANPNNSFAALITQLGTSFARPFVGLIRPTALGNGGVVAWSLLVAIAAYAVMAWAVGALLGSVSRGLNRARYERSSVQREQAIPSTDLYSEAPVTAAQGSATVQPTPVNVTVNQGVPASAGSDVPAQGEVAPGPAGSEDAHAVAPAPAAEPVVEASKRGAPGNEQVTAESERKEGSLIGPTPG